MTDQQQAKANEIHQTVDGLAQAAKHGIEAMYNTVEATKAVTRAMEPLRRQYRAYKTRQKEIRHLRIKSITLGLTYLERQRLKGKYE